MAAGIALGNIRLEPDGPVTAGSRGTWRLVYTVGPRGLANGGGLRIAPPHRGMVRWDVGRVIAYASREGAACEVTVENAHPISYHWRHFPVVQVVVRGVELAAGDTVTVVLGERGGYVSGYRVRARAQEFAQQGARFEAWVDPLGNWRALRETTVPDTSCALADPPQVDVVAAEPARLRVYLRSPGTDDGPARVQVVAEDRYGNPAPQYAGRPDLAVVHGEALPAAPVKDGRLSTELPALAEDKVTRVQAVDTENELVGRSNPLAPGLTRPWRVYWGDLHVMTGAGGGGMMLGNTRSALEHGRDAKALDFAAITKPSNSPEQWEFDRQACRDFYQPGEYVPILACERGLKTGHKNVYLAEDCAEVCPGGPAEAIWEYLEGKRGMAIPHHTNVHSESHPRQWGPQDWSTHNPRFERLLEITQDRGSFETDQPGVGGYFGGFGSSAQDALARGMRVGFVGGTDNHRGQPGSFVSPLGGLDPHEVTVGGLTAVLAEELTREGIWQALWSRRCYATNGPRLVLWFAVGGHPMGSELAGEDARALAERRRIEVKVIGTRPIERITIVRNNEDWRSEQVGGYEADLELEDDTRLQDIPPAAGAARDGLAAWYYVRVLQEDAGLAWSSPVWVEL